MIALGNGSQAGPLFVGMISALGLIASPLAELLIAKLLPRVGPPPGTLARVATAAITATLCAAFAFRFGPGPALPAFVFLVVLGPRPGDEAAVDVLDAELLGLEPVAGA